MYNVSYMQCKSVVIGSMPITAFYLKALSMKNAKNIDERNLVVLPHSLYHIKGISRTQSAAPKPCFQENSAPASVVMQVRTYVGNVHVCI